jgi:site-specific recombinase XerD
MILRRGVRLCLLKVGGLLTAIDAGSEQPDRDRALVLLLLETGIRLSEAAGLTVHDP